MLEALAIALVILSGVAIFVMSLSTLDSLYLTRQNYYQDYRFAELFAELKRAPNGLEARIRDLPGVDQVETRVVAIVKLDLPAFTDPVTARLVSLPDQGEPLMNRLYLPPRASACTGKEQRSGGQRSVCQSAQSFARRSAHGNYQRQTPDIEHRRHRAVARVHLSAGTGRGAYARKDQISHHFLNEELRQLRTLATAFPVIFFAVAAFLLNIVISRIVALQFDGLLVFVSDVFLHVPGLRFRLHFCHMQSIRANIVITQ